MRLTRPRNRPPRLASLRRFPSADAGSTLTLFALSLPLLLAAVGIGLDYSRALATKARMQSVADAAALASAQEFQMAKADPSKISAVATSFVVSQLNGQTPAVVVDTKALTVQVTVESDVPMTVGQVIWQGNMHVVASATAKMSNGLPLCLLGLDPKAQGTIELEKNAWLTAPGCLVNSNSKSPQGLKSMDNAMLTAGFICSAGGKVQSKNANYSPQPMTDCSPIPDPLAARQVPADAACSYTNKVVDGLTVTLQPGTYCGGLTVTNGAQVTFADGIHVIKNGPFVVDNNASVTGAHVAFYLRGTGANLTFAAASTINLAAPKDGSLAGILVFDDPTGAPAPEKPANHPKVGGSPRAHQILSNNARTLLGTIYMPQGRLIVDATSPIADRSAYTVLVVQQLDLYSGPNLVLNSDYGASEIPVPMGVGPYDGNVVLSN